MIPQASAPPQELLRTLPCYGCHGDREEGTSCCNVVLFVTHKLSEGNARNGVSYAAVAQQFEAHAAGGN